MHGTLPEPPRTTAETAGKTAARFKKAGIATAVAVVATVGVYDYVNSTRQGHRLLIRWGFEYPPDCS